MAGMDEGEGFKGRKVPERVQEILKLGGDQ